MGSLVDFDNNCVGLRQLKHQFNITVFVETGCFQGNSLKYASKLFNKLFSCDIDPAMVALCSNIPNTTIKVGTSLEFLEQILPELERDNVMFYLDAHLPDCTKINDSWESSDLNFPLIDELAIINKYRKGRRDVIICDDLRMYEDGPFTGGNWADRSRYSVDLSFLTQYNYHVMKFYNQEGYILLT